MNDTNKMLLAIMNGQSAMKAELLGKIDKLDKKIDGLDKKIDTVKSELKEEIKKLAGRVDKIGLAEARLEDDAPTIADFEKLEKRVDRLSHLFINA